MELSAIWTIYSRGLRPPFPLQQANPSPQNPTRYKHTKRHCKHSLKMNFELAGGTTHTHPTGVANGVTSSSSSNWPIFLTTKQPPLNPTSTRSGHYRKPTRLVPNAGGVNAERRKSRSARKSTPRTRRKSVATTLTNSSTTSKTVRIRNGHKTPRARRSGRTQSRTQIQGQRSPPRPRWPRTLARQRFSGVHGLFLAWRTVGYDLTHCRESLPLDGSLHYLNSPGPDIPVHFAAFIS